MQQTNSKFFTYQTRIGDIEEEAFLEKTAVHLSKVEITLFKDFCKGKNILSLKNDYLKTYQITARQFNSCRMVIEGKIRSYKEGLDERISLLKTKIKGLNKHIFHLKDSFKIHQKKRRLFILENKLKNLEKDKEENKVRICFGGKSLFHQQFFLEENGYKDFSEWKKDWKNQRENSFFLVGSKDESFGNQSCQLIKEGSFFTLKIRLPNIFPDKKILTIRGIDFAYGKEEIEECLEENEKRRSFRLNKEAYADYGKAINYRFKKDKKGWRLFVSIEKAKPLIKSKEHTGYIGIDLNANHFLN